MRSIRLGSQNTTTTSSSSSSSSSSKPQNFLSAKNKTKSSPTLMKNNNKNNKNHTNADDKPNPTRTVWITAKERGQAIIRTGRSPAKRHPHITTISTTRNKNTGGSSSTSTTAPTPRTRTGTRTTAVALQPPPPPPPLPPLTPLFANITITNPSTHDTPPSPPPPTATTTRRTIALTTTTTTTTTTQQLQFRPHLLHPHSLSPLPLAARRPPLHFRDQNENKKMGYDTSANPSTTTTTTTTNSRPQMPSLGSAAARGINRTPLTPKIAAATRPSQPQTPSIATAAAVAATVTDTNNTNATATTPLPRRTQPRPTSTIIATAPNSSSRASYDDPGAVSAAAFSPHLNSNVTPRSGSRQSRVDSASSTPNGTPIHDRSDAWESAAAFPFSSPLNQGDRSRRPVVTFNAVSPERNIPPRQDTTTSRDSKFFHASDAKTTRPMSASKMVSPKNPTFFYVNGNGIASKSSSPATLSPPLSPGLNRSQENVSSKFMYANGTPELRPTPPPMLSRASGSGSGPGVTGPNASKGPTVRSAATLQRPVSPSKLPLHSSSSYRNSIGSQSAAAMSTAAASTARVQVSPPPPLMPSTPGLRSPGTATSRSSGHSRSGSLAMGEGVSEPLKPMASPTMGLFPPANLSPTQAPPLTLASIIQAADEFTEHENETNQTSSPDDQSMLQSPTKSTVSSADPVTELIANARRERKVQDLQIRNASLEAINRTLERQMRKQTAELRRYRRLSRSGHLSLASTTMSSRVTSGTMSELELDLESLGLSDLSEEEPSMQDLEEESLSETDSISSDMSASVLAARDAKHRQRDEERLKLDLSKHQQILVDSQKINQSIKRCLDWTEELINEGRKALQYKVRVSDIRLGGRVLDPLDEEEETSKLPLPNDTVMLGVKPIEEELEVPTSWGIEPQDRDSGIELPRDGG
ncbi:hypothetical protein F5Y09DRAFT_357332 [Xylaria sp. FL1042]|nr:hypothetical protein F5Y09DRAFT_357332 [Xylaria sp. FL1042]